VWFVLTLQDGRARGKPTIARQLATDAAAGTKINTLGSPRLASSFSFLPSFLPSFLSSFL
jgi:hypothetical protein